MNDTHIIMGIDPGTRVTGYGVLKKENNTIIPLDFGCIRPPAKLPLNKRYLIIFNAIEELVLKYQPTAISIETQFVQKNIQSALKLGMARGVCIIAAEKNNIPVCEYTPRKAKQAVTGNGSAGKTQVKKMMQILFNLKDINIPEDAADALAIALCHLNQHKVNLCTNI